MKPRLKKGKLYQKAGFKKGAWVDDYQPILNILKSMPDIEIVSQMIYDNGIEGCTINIYFDPKEVEKASIKTT